MTTDISRSSEFSHYGVKGMKWGVRRELRKKEKAQRRKSQIEADRVARTTIADKYRPIGVTKRGKMIIKRRGPLGLITPRRKLSRRRAQLLIDQIGLNVEYKKLRRDRYFRNQVAERVLTEMAMYRMRDAKQHYNEKYGALERSNT